MNIYRVIKYPNWNGMESFNLNHYIVGNGLGTFDFIVQSKNHMARDLIKSGDYFQYDPGMLFRGPTDVLNDIGLALWQDAEWRIKHNFVINLKRCELTCARSDDHSCCEDCVGYVSIMGYQDDETTCSSTTAIRFIIHLRDKRYIATINGSIYCISMKDPMAILM